MTLRAARLQWAMASLGIAAILIAGLLLSQPNDEVVFVPAGASVANALVSAPAGATVRLEPGTHEGPLVVGRELTVEGLTGAIVSAPATAEAAITVGADDVSLRNLQIRGGSTGILVEHAHDVELDNVSVSGAELHGILIAGAQARVSAATVSGLHSPYAQGIELFDAPETVIQGSRISGGQEGIASFLSHDVRFRDNVVTDTTMRAIAVNEMSEAKVTDNLVERAAGAGLYCGDMSHCEFSGNRVDEVSPGEAGRSVGGWGLVVDYHAVASIEDDHLRGAMGPSTTLTGSQIVDGSPLERGSGWRTLVPVAAVTALALAALALVAALAAPFLSRLVEKRPVAVAGRGLAIAAIATLGIGLAVQTFHMAEHFLQVFRVHADGVPSRGGIVGSVVEPEWVHFTYNSAVFLMFAVVAAARVRGWKPGGDLFLGDTLLAAGLLVQGYHVIEHTAKLAQHLVSGAKVNPGLLGDHVDLVWLHFGINLAVYAAFLGACVFYIGVRRSLRKVAIA